MAKKIIFRFVIGFLALLIIILTFLPMAVRKIAISNSKEWVGRTISLEKLGVNYFTGTFKLIDFKLYESDDTAVFVGFDTLIIDTEPYRLIRNEIVIEGLYLKGLTAHVEMYDSAFNFDDLIAFHQRDTSNVAEDAIPGDPLRFELSDFEMRRASFTFNDADIDKKMELDNIDFLVPYIAWDQDHKSEAGLRFDFKNGGYFQSNIDINPIDGEFEADIALNELDINDYSDFVAKYINLGTFEGQTDIEIDLAGNVNTPEETTASGLLVLSNFKLTDHGEKPLFGVENFRVRLDKADPAAGRYLIDSVFLSRPNVYFEMFDSTNNIVEYFKHIFPSEDSTLAADVKVDTVVAGDGAEGELFYALNSFVIDQGVVDITDARAGEPFKYHLRELRLSADSITSLSDWVETRSDMLLNNRGKLVAEVDVNPSNPMDLAVNYTITDFMLSDLNIYSRHYMGFPILYGDMYYKASTEVINGQITSENKLIIHNVELGHKGGGLYDLPLKFALFLLKDKDGVITLDVPVRGDLKDPKVSVGKIVWNTFKNLIIKAAAAPVKLLSGLIGADPAEIAMIEYDFLDTAFTEKKQRQMELLLQLEREKPDLEIELIYFNDPELEKKQIAMSEVGKMYEKSGANKDYRKDREAFEEFARKQAASDSSDIYTVCMSIVDGATIDSIALAMDHKRAFDLSNYMNQANDSTEILIVPSAKEAPKNIGSKPVFEVKYGMKEENLH